MEVGIASFYFFNVHFNTTFPQVAPKELSQLTGCGQHSKICYIILQWGVPPPQQRSCKTSLVDCPQLLIQTQQNSTYPD